MKRQAKGEVQVSSGKKCFYCHEDGHIKKLCPKRKKKEKAQENGRNVALVEQDEGYESAYVLVVATKHLDRQWK